MRQTEPWRRQEIALLRRLWPKQMGSSEIFPRFPGRSEQAVRYKARSLNLYRRSVMPNPLRLGPRNEGYFAAIIDGEGSLIISKFVDKRRGNLVCYQPVIRLGNSDQAIIQWLLTKVGGKISERRSSKRTPKGAEAKYFEVWGIQSVHELAKVLPILTRYLVGEKKEKAIVMADFVKAIITKPQKTIDRKRYYEEFYKQPTRRSLVAV